MTASTRRKAFGSENSIKPTRSGPETERELVNLFMRHIPTIVGVEHVSQTEVGAGRRIADVVTLVNCRKQWLPLPTNLSIAESVALAALRREGPTRIDLLEKRCGVARGSLRCGNLSRLEEAGIVKRGSGGRIALGRSLSRAIRVIAFEMKLDRWSLAVEQASRYRSYADCTYVVLPDRHDSARERIARRCREVSTGLIIVGSNSFEVVVQAQVSSSHDWRREFVISRVMGVSHR